MPSAIVLADTVTTPNDSKVRLVYEGTTTGTKTITVPEVNARMVTDNTTAYDNDTSTFIANTLTSGAIIERGSNANGSYVKYADGTLICSLATFVSDQAIATAYGALFTGTRTWTFPHVFSSTPVASNQGKWGTGSSWNTSGGANTTGVTFIFLDNVSRAVGTNTYLNYIAIGRWK